MNVSKRCIFHIPNYIDINRKSASNIRPFKMIKAFQENGYIVDVVMGYAKDRKKQINNIKDNIKKGIKYDFMYSESSTMPTLLTEKKHFPTHPLLDFSFMKYCKKNGIKIGLFYRDMHWRFEVYKKTVPVYIRFFSVPCYKYDIYKYKKLLDVIYLASPAVKQYLPNSIKKAKNIKIDVLPPGCELNMKENKKKNSNVLNIFYVGGISSDIYNFEKLFEVVKEQTGIKLTVCCREQEWEKMQPKLEKYLNENINIVHESGEGLEKYYQEADVCSLIFNKYKYMQIAMPVKLFEYLSHNKPIIATKGTVAGEFVEKNNIGWVIEYEIEEISKLLQYLKSNRESIEQIQMFQKNIIKENSWRARAEKVIKDL